MGKCRKIHEFLIEKNLSKIDELGTAGDFVSAKKTFPAEKCELCKSKLTLGISTEISNREQFWKVYNRRQKVTVRFNFTKR